jgi:hypothetical protein
MATPQHFTNPFIPRPAKKEVPFSEDLVTPEHPHQIHTMKQDVPILVPNYNTLYDRYGSKQGWRYSADAYANGSVTTIANTPVLVSVSLAEVAGTQGFIWNLGQWPGGTLLYPVIRFFSVGPTTATFATQGAISIVFYDQFGNPTPLGVVANNAFSSYNNDTILPSPITDPGFQGAIGTLSFTLNTGATVGTYNWQMAFAAAYLLPALKGYNIERIGDGTKHLDIHHHRNHEHL